MPESYSPNRLSPNRLDELLHTPDVAGALNEICAAVDRFDRLRDQAESDLEWQAIDELAEPWEDALTHLEKQHRALMGLRRVQWRSETVSATRSPVLMRRIRRVYRPRIRARRPLRSRRVRRASSRTSTRDPSEPGPCRRGPCAGEGRQR